MNADRGGRGEHLSAYLAGELDADERAALEAELDRDAVLRAELHRIRATNEALERLPEPEPPAGLQARILAAAAEEIAARRPDELAARRERRVRTLRPLFAAAAAAAVIGVVGVGAGYVMSGGGGDDAATGAAPAADTARMAEAESLRAPEVPVVETNNDFDARELTRLAVGVDTSNLSPGLTPREAEPLSRQLLGQLLTYGEDEAFAADAQPEGGAVEEGDGDSVRTTSDEGREGPAGASAVSRCLPELVESADGPVVPVYVELAKFDGEPAVIYALATIEPDSGEYRRIQVWAVARSDCHVLHFTQYDRPG